MILEHSYLSVVSQSQNIDSMQKACGVEKRIRVIQSCYDAFARLCLLYRHWEATFLAWPPSTVSISINSLLSNTAVNDSFWGHV